MPRGRQAGASAVMILVIFVLLMVGFYALYTLSRVTGAGDERADTQKRLAAAAAALERFAAANGRLPCPADGAANSGLEQQASAATCTFGATGTLPWLTLGLTSDAGLDGWGRKISYRVYTGNAGSLTQPGGVSMVDCDTVELTPGGATASAGGLGGLCVTNADPYLRNTTPAQFLAGKGLPLNDYGTNHTDVAYVLISHGTTGAGAWTIAGTQLDLPTGDERDNTRETGPFTAKAFSDPDTSFTSASHFDDLLAYATIPDLVKRAGLEARNWPDHIVASVTFDRPTLAAALGSNPGSDTGQATIAFTNVKVTALDASGNAQDISFQGSGPNQGIGGVSGGTDLQSAAGAPDEALRLDFGEHARKFAFALDGFGYQSTFFGFPIWYERVEVDFYDVVGTTATLKGSVTKMACHADGAMATFSVDAGVDFNRVEIKPQPTTAFLSTNATSFLLSEIVACSAAVTCQTPAQTAGNLCP